MWKVIKERLKEFRFWAEYLALGEQVENSPEDYAHCYLISTAPLTFHSSSFRFLSVDGSNTAEGKKEIPIRTLSWQVSNTDEGIDSQLTLQQFHVQLSEPEDFLIFHFVFVSSSRVQTRANDLSFTP